MSCAEMLQCAGVEVGDIVLLRPLLAMGNVESL